MAFHAWPVTSAPSPHFLALYQKLRGIGAFLCQEICHGSTNLGKGRMGELDQSPGVMNESQVGRSGVVLETKMETRKEHGRFRKCVLHKL